MDWLYLAITVLSLITAILAWIAKIRWSEEYKEAKDAQIRLLKEKVDFYKEVTSTQLINYFKTTLKELESSQADLLQKLEKEKHANSDKNNQKFLKKELWKKEMHHRVKNSLAVIAGLTEIQQTKTENECCKKELKLISKRIFSIAITHEVINTADNLETVSLENFINTLDRLTNINIKANIQSKISLHFKVLLPVMLLLNEYFYHFEEEGLNKISIDAKNIQDDIFLDITHNKISDKPIFTDPKKDITEILLSQVRGSLKNDNGILQLKFPSTLNTKHT